MDAIVNHKLANFTGTDVFSLCVLPVPVRTSQEVVNSEIPGQQVMYQMAGTTDRWWVATSPNCAFVPKVTLGPRVVKARKDGRYGLDDRVLHPQYYARHFEYICCIPRIPSDPNDPLRVMWWTPELSDMVPIQGVAFDAFIGILKPHHLKGLRDHRDRYVRLSRTYQAKRGASAMCNLLESTICHCYSKLAGTGMTRKELVVAVAEMQRACLDMEAFLAYCNEFEPRLTLPPDRRKEVQVDLMRMGAFTEEARIAERLLAMGIPVWLLRPADRLVVTTMNILNICSEDSPDGVVLDDWEDDVGRPDPHPLIYNGPPGTEMLRATQRMGCMFFDLTQVTRVQGAGGVGGDTSSTSGSMMEVTKSALTQARGAKAVGRGRSGAGGKQRAPENHDDLRCKYSVIPFLRVVSNHYFS